MALIGIALLLLGSALPVLALRWIDPPTTAFILHDRAAGRTAVYYRWVDLERMSPHLPIAVVASEDQRFPDHWGFDLGSIADAVEERVRGGRLRGASTISQQVAKNLFLWPGRSFVRKSLEAWFTAWIELLWPKRRILEVYLNVAQFGPGLYGAGTASVHFFGVPCRLLEPDEAALLAAVLPNPEKLHVHDPSDYTLDRRDWILDHMRMLGGPAYLGL